jgi:hypothetical protein
MGFLLVYAICFATEMFIKLAETQWHSKKYLIGFSILLPV